MLGLGRCKPRRALRSVPVLIWLSARLLCREGFVDLGFVDSGGCGGSAASSLASETVTDLHGTQGVFDRSCAVGHMGV